MDGRRLEQSPRRGYRVRLMAAAAAVVLAVVAGGRPSTMAACPDPFEFLGPSITITGKEQQKLDAGDAFVRVLPAEGREIAVLGAAAVDFDGGRLAAWMQQIEALKKSEHVPAVGRFSEPPTLADLARHVLEDRDVEALRKCRVDRCDMKLTADEIALVGRELDAAGANWRAAAQDVFRRLMLRRVLAYRAYGHAGIGTYADGHSDEPLADIAAALLNRSPYLLERTPALVEHLRRYPNLPLPGSDSFLYWSQEEFGGRPVTSVTHVTILRPEGPGLPDALVAGRQVFATHYQNGSLSLTLLLRGCPGPPHYLTYISRSEVDVIRGMLGWLARRVIQGRVEDGSVSILEGLRERLSKPPAGSGPGSH
jgi:hypothetical protein